jgi:hypothetical protein
VPFDFISITDPANETLLRRLAQTQGGVGIILK